MGFVAFGHAIEVALGQVLLVVASALDDLGFLPCAPRIQDGDDFRLRQLRRHHLEHGVEQLEFVLGQIDLGENQTLREAVIRHEALLEEVAAFDGALHLLVAVRQEGQFHAEGMGLRVLVELFEEGVLFKALKHQFGPQVLGKPR